MKEKNVAFDYTKKIKDRIIGLGADLVGIADVKPLKELKVDPPDLLEPFNRAVSIAIKLPQAVFGEISPIPASQVLDEENWYAAISHKAVARMAGLGWQGKNLLLITPKYGSRVRLVTVLTKAPLDVDGPIKNRCGECSACQDACPAQAIKGVSTESHYKSRNEAMHFSRCKEKVVGEFAKIPEVGVPICGICIKVCPFGRKMRASS